MFPPHVASPSLGPHHDAGPGAGDIALASSPPPKFRVLSNSFNRAFLHITAELDTGHSGGRA